jgi:hypothetical protein
MNLVQQLTLNCNLHAVVCIYHLTICLLDTIVSATILFSR